MKRFFGLISLALGLVSSGLAQFQPTPIINPLNAVQQTYIDSSFHSVPFAIAYPLSGAVTLVFDPSTTSLDQNHVATHMMKATSWPGAAAQPFTTAVIPSIVSNVVNTQVFRTINPFGVTNAGSGATLASIPGLQANLETGGKYTFRAVLYVTSGAGGTKVDFGGTASPNAGSVIAQIVGLGGTAIQYGDQVTSFLSGPAGAASTATTEITIEGSFTINTGGTFVIQFAQASANSGASTVLIGSNLTVTQITQ